jgi:Ni/Fe-hydrogenase subunit HybB-like protein
VTASVFVLIGVLCERYVIVLPGLTHPPVLFPGMEIVGSEVEEGVVGYSVSVVEIVQALGVFGLIGFLFVAGLKVFPLLPTEALALPRPEEEEAPASIAAPQQMQGA